MATNSNKYKFSIFNLYLSLGNDFIGIYNTLHDSAIAIDETTFKMLKENEMKIESDILGSLLSNKIIFPLEFNEKSYFSYYINKTKYTPRHATFIISLTSACNLCCEYCFEGKAKDPKSMSSDVGLQTIKFITKLYEKHTSIRKLYIAFFGGEPLLNKEIMFLICNEIGHLRMPPDLINFTLTSNLTLLTDDDIKLIRKYNFTNVQVALDGSRPFHNRRRKSLSVKDSFDLIFENIKKLIDVDINVMIFLNFDKENWESYNDLIPFIRDNLPYNKIVFILNPITKSLCNSNCNINFMNSTEEADLFLKLYSKLKEADFNIQAFGQRDMTCIFTSDISCIIDPEGCLYKCGMMLGVDKFKTGDIYSDVYKDLNYTSILEEPWKSCLKSGCAYLPICGGGCRALALVNNGDLKSIYCQKEYYYDNIYKIILRDHFINLVKGGDYNEK